MKANRWSPFRFKNGKTTKNRVVVPPMASQTADAEGLATDATYLHYMNLTQSGAGLIFVEYSHVHQSGKGEENQLGVHSADTVPGLRKISTIIKSSGALSGLQIVHVGGKGETSLADQPLIGPSSIAVPVKGWQPEVPQAMTKEQIKLMIEWYVAAAHRAVQAGFDILELHAAHGYGLNQWLSPITNQRSDDYGGSIYNRARLIFDIVARIKVELPNLLLAIRLPAQDHMDQGLSTTDMVWVVAQLEHLGVDLVDVSSGIGGWRRPEGRVGQGYLVSDATLLKQHLKVPVIGVGGIETGDFIDELLEANRVDFTAVGRAILKNPMNWNQTNLNQKGVTIETIRASDSNIEPTDVAFCTCASA